MEGRPISAAGRRRPVVLTIAGSDSGGGAGVAADLKTFEAHGVWGTVALTAVTAQNTLGVQAWEAVAPELVRAQVASVVSDFGVDAAKTGMLATPAVVDAVVRIIRELGVRPLVVDPVSLSKHGNALLEPEALELVRDRLLPLATVLTPNLPEAAALTGRSEPVVTRADMVAVGMALLELGPEVVMVKGGHLPAGGDSPDLPDSPDLVVTGSGPPLWLEGERLGGRHTHGTGCVLSAAICARLALGVEAVEACGEAKRFVAGAIAAGVELGSGVGPVDAGWSRTRP